MSVDLAKKFDARIKQIYAEFDAYVRRDCRILCKKLDPNFTSTEEAFWETAEYIESTLPTPISESQRSLLNELNSLITWWLTRPVAEEIFS